MKKRKTKNTIKRTCFCGLLCWSHHHSKDAFLSSFSVWSPPPFSFSCNSLETENLNPESVKHKPGKRSDLLGLSSQGLPGLVPLVLVPDLLVAVDQNGDEPQLQPHDQHIHHNLRDHSDQLRTRWNNQSQRWDDCFFNEKNTSVCKCVC